MAEVVFLLGAGASLESGAPLMKDFLDKAEDLPRAGETRFDKEHFENVFKAIGALKAVPGHFLIDIKQP